MKTDSHHYIRFDFEFYLLGSGIYFTFPTKIYLSNSRTYGIQLFMRFYSMKSTHYISNNLLTFLGEFNISATQHKRQQFQTLLAKMCI